MGTFIVHRLMHTIFVLIIVSFLAFSLIHIMPGDPALTMLGYEAEPAQVEALRHELGLDRPFLIQYVNWLADVVRGDLGTSIFYKEKVSTLIVTRIPVTFHLAIISTFLSIAVGIIAGIICAVRRGSVLDSLLTVFANLGMSIPIFWLGILGIYILSLKLGWLPVQGYTSPFDDFWLNTKQIIMPCIAMSVVVLASITRQTRSSMLEVIRQDYIRTAQSKGLEEGKIIKGHALKNALIPIVTLVGLQVRRLVGGSVLIEQVFNIPGMGRLLVNSVMNKDFLVVQGSILVIALLVCIANLIVDISYGYIDPRIRQN